METYLTIEELADYLKIPEKTIRGWVLHRVIPYRKVMKAIRFRISEIEKWINDGCLGFLAPEVANDERDLLDDAISLDELAEQEAVQEGNAGGEE
jgi:excisionase family DNA binding protein